ncbi:MAG: sensor histidine kinase [Candidatus Eisenbacteria bacterium]|uniref:histidine kinase n=1 Tax=Eiseniibacteriota bacterium TaxID=2212470 RepID=A0A948RY83_UNCEI|nr:sensor histidine kinase [Candidatus Eisenbacteria bacterium]
MTMRWRILLWMLPVALGPLFIMAAQGYHCARQAIIASQKVHMQSVLEARRIEIESWFAQIESDFGFLQISPCLQGLCGSTPASADSSCCAETCNLLSDLHVGTPFYHSISTFDVNWNQLVSSAGTGNRVGSIRPDDSGVVKRPDPAGGAFPSKLLKERLAAQDGLLTTPPIQREDGTVMVQAGSRVLNPRHGGLAYIAAEIDIDNRMNTILKHGTGLGRTGEAFLFLPGGVFPMIDGFDAENNKYRFHSYPKQITDGGGEVVRYRSASGKKVLGVSALIPRLNGTLVIEIDEQEAFAWLRVFRNRALMTGLITLVLILVIANYGARVLAQPLREFAAVAHRIAAGQSEERIGRLAGAEAQEVAEAFNHMIDELSASHRRLLQAASLAAVGELSSSIVHEMRNPLSSIKMNLQALRHNVEEDPFHRELADIASEQALRLERMLSELLNYGKPLELNKTRLRFIEIANNVKDILRSESEEKEIRVIIKDLTGGTAFCADPEQLRRALTNLTANAIQASPPGESVILSAEYPVHSPGTIRLSVADNGPGFRTADIHRLFQPFYTTRDEGTGLGLANVKKIVEGHSGFVFAENRRKGGALFSLSLPRGAEE